jgi:hypothetical protein
MTLIDAFRNFAKVPKRDLFHLHKTAGIHRNVAKSYHFNVPAGTIVHSTTTQFQKVINTTADKGWPFYSHNV